MITLAAALAATLAVPARPAALPSFESALGGVRSSVLQTQKAQRELRALDLSADISRAADGARSLTWDADRLRWRVQDIRRRAQWLRRQNPRRRDAFFESDLQRLVWDLRDYRLRSQALEAEAARLERQASPDPALVTPASSLLDETGSFRSYSQWLVGEARWARMDLAALGYSFEAWDIERESNDADWSAQNSSSTARRLLDKIRASQAP